MNINNVKSFLKLTSTLHKNNIHNFWIDVPSKNDFENYGYWHS